MRSKNTRPIITRERLLELLHYHPGTGVFRWRVTPNRLAGYPAVGDVAGNVRPDLYRYIKLDDRLYRSSRLAWLYVYGAWPKKTVDHIDRCPNHDWISNLREATHSQNVGNTHVRRNNLLGVKGVSMTNNFRFTAKINAHGKLRHLGTFDTAEEANRVYMKAARAFYGEFAHDGTVSK